MQLNMRLKTPRTLVEGALMIALTLAAFASAAHAQRGLPESSILDTIPPDAMEIAEAMKNVEAGNEITLHGRVLLRADSFDPDRAILHLVDESAAARIVADEEAEKDGTSAEAADIAPKDRATIRFVDDDGDPLPISLRGRHRLGDKSEVFIVGTVHEADGSDTLIVNATKMHVPESSVPIGLILTEEPENVKNVADAKKDVSAGETVAVRGRIGGSSRPFVDGRAVFTIVGEGPLACSDIPGDACKMPWDYCCVPRNEIRKHSATIQIVDENGAPLRTSIKGRRGIRELSDLTIVGTVVSTARGSLILKAEGIYVNGHPQT